MKTRLNKNRGEGQDSRSMCFDLAKIFSTEKSYKKPDLMSILKSTGNNHAWETNYNFSTL